MGKLLTIFFCFVISNFTSAQIPILKFALIGDYGKAGSNELAVANLVKSWSPNFIITLGDNNYEDGAASTIDANIGQYYHEFISPYIGIYGQGDTINSFFPSLGNHDWVTAGAVPYLNYFILPNNERYYDFVKGNVHFYSIDSDVHEPDGNDSSSAQATWLKNKLAISTERWKIVYFHHPPYSSGSTHGSTVIMQWPFKRWGASIVFSGHEHVYEKLNINNFIYVVNGLGGKSIYSFGSPIPGSLVRYNSDYGAMLANVYNDSINFKFINKNGTVIDDFKIISPVSGITQINNQIHFGYSLKQNYPNPFNPKTIIRYSIPNTKSVMLKVYNVLGNVVATLINEKQNSGSYEIEFNGENLSSGIYFYKIIAGEFVDIKRMTLIK